MRWVPEKETEPIREVMGGFLWDAADDPAQAGDGIDRQCRGVTNLPRQSPEVPIAKMNRRLFVWVARAIPRKRDTRAMYTWNLDKMYPHEEF